MLIENVEQELDPVLDPVLERRFLRKGRQVTVQLADKEVRQHFITTGSVLLASRASLVFLHTRAARAMSVLLVTAVCTPAQLPSV